MPNPKNPLSDPKKLSPETQLVHGGVHRTAFNETSGGPGSPSAARPVNALGAGAGEIIDASARARRSGRERSYL